MIGWFLFILNILKIPRSCRDFVKGGGRALGAYKKYTNIKIHVLDSKHLSHYLIPVLYPCWITVLEFGDLIIFHVWMVFRIVQ